MASGMHSAKRVDIDQRDLKNLAPGRHAQSPVITDRASARDEKCERTDELEAVL